ncbi:MAG: prolyl-tRNA editing protein [Candidatus Pelagibacter sp.]|jgi:Cys-tRNA(Pro) deacylase|nr:MAG: prolyl-tRNA editing protein [Candidatus Pelagibacter sp.]HIO51055.1 YbaK/EbsC family protein [Pelagibacteraceae bacterium]|tara:strand:+ start:1372 stop:1854 length:483 start_codon:yes stop_codon:yes gene_type:complete
MEDLLNKESVKRVSQKLKDFDESLKVIVLDGSARTAQDAADSLNTEVGSIIKSLFLRTKNSFLLCLVAGDKRCSLNKIKKILGEKDVSMGNAEQVKQVTGFTIGGVSPVGHLNPIKIYIDQSLSRFENIFGAAGHPNCVFKINFIDLQKITSGEVMDIVE